MFKDYSDEIVFVKNRSPLVLGIGEGEIFVASDLRAFSDKTNRIVFLPDKCFGILKKDAIQLFDFDNKEMSIQVQEVDAEYLNADKKDFEHLWSAFKKRGTESLRSSHEPKAHCFILK